MTILDDTAPAYPAPLPPKQHKRNSAPVSPPPAAYDPNYETPMNARAAPNRHERDTTAYDDDDRTNIEAEEMGTDDAVRKLGYIKKCFVTVQ